MEKVASEFGKRQEIVTRIFVNLYALSQDDQKDFIEILDEVMKVELDPHPLSAAIADHFDDVLWEIMPKFGMDKESIYYSNMLKIMTNQPQLIKYFLNEKIFNKLCEYACDNVFNISSEAISLLEEIMFSKNLKVQIEIEKYLNSHPEEIMNMFISMLEKDNYLSKRETMKILHSILSQKKQDEFFKYYVSKKEHLKFAMISLNDENVAINIEGFKLLVFFFKATYEMRGKKVNETISKNWDKLTEFLETFLENKDADENLEKERDFVIKALKEYD